MLKTNCARVTLTLAQLRVIAEALNYSKRVLVGAGGINIGGPNAKKAYEKAAETVDSAITHILQKGGDVRQR